MMRRYVFHTREPGDALDAAKLIDHRFRRYKSSHCAKLV
jgi:hypothetical protein